MLLSTVCANEPAYIRAVNYRKSTRRATTLLRPFPGLNSVSPRT